MKGGPQPGSGQPGYGKLKQALKEVERLSPIYFTILEEWLTEGNERERIEAMRMMSKFVEKTIPQDVNIPETITVKIAKEVATKYEGDEVTST